MGSFSIFLNVTFEDVMFVENLGEFIEDEKQVKKGVSLDTRSGQRKKNWWSWWTPDTALKWAQRKGAQRKKFYSRFLNLIDKIIFVCGKKYLRSFINRYYFWVLKKISDIRSFIIFIIIFNCVSKIFILYKISWKIFNSSCIYFIIIIIIIIITIINCNFNRWFCFFPSFLTLSSF